MTFEQYNRSITKEVMKGRRLLHPNEMEQLIQLYHQLTGENPCRQCPEVMERVFRTITEEANNYKNL